MGGRGDRAVASAAAGRHRRRHPQQGTCFKFFFCVCDRAANPSVFRTPIQHGYTIVIPLSLVVLLKKSFFYEQNETLSEKEIKRLGFALSEVRYNELLPLLARLNELEEQQAEEEVLFWCCNFEICS